MAGTGIPYFPITLPSNSVVGRLAPNSGPTEAIPFAQLAAALGVGGSTYLLASNISGTNTITGTTATAPPLAANQVVFLIPANTNTGAVTFDRDAQATPKSVFYNGAALVGGEIAAGVPSVWFYDGTQYNIIANGIAAGNAAARGTVASATTTNLDASSSLTQQITGATTITGITLANGHVRIVEFAGILTLTNSASLILPGGVNITTAAGNVGIFIGEPSGVVRCIFFSAKQPTRTVITSGTGATYTTPAGATRIDVWMIGGGGGGSVGGTAFAAGTTGGNTTFGTLTAQGASASATPGNTPTNTATASNGDDNSSGGAAAGTNGTGANASGTNGASSPRGGAGAGGANSTGAGGDAKANTGSGGGGGASSGASGSAAPGGGHGAWLKKLIVSPAATYTYTVGTGGAATSAPANGTASGAGAAGIIIVDEFYN